mgnify:CR=1 FL=1
MSTTFFKEHLKFNSRFQNQIFSSYPSIEIYDYIPLLNHHTARRCHLMLDPDAKKFCKFARLFTRRKQSPNFLQNFSTGSKSLMQEPDAIRCKTHYAITITQSIPRWYSSFDTKVLQICIRWGRRHQVSNIFAELPNNIKHPGETYLV